MMMLHGRYFSACLPYLLIPMARRTASPMSASTKSPVRNVPMAKIEKSVVDPYCSVRATSKTDAYAHSAPEAIRSAPATKPRADEVPRPISRAMV